MYTAYVFRAYYPAACACAATGNGRASNTLQTWTERVGAGEQVIILCCRSPTARIHSIEMDAREARRLAFEYLSTAHTCVLNTHTHAYIIYMLSRTRALLMPQSNLQQRGRRHARVRRLFYLLGE